MATVTGVTKAKMEEIRNDTIIAARVENGVLYFKKGDNTTEFNVGPIVLPAIAAWPVGSIFMNTNSTNPKILLGVPSDSPVTWVRWGQGRVPVGVNEGDPEGTFNVPEATGGAKTHQLAISEMPAHNHTGSTYTGGHHYHNTVALQEGPGGSNAYAAGAAALTQRTIPSTTDGAHSHFIPVQGGNSAHNILQPYITVYMWKRTV